MRRIRLFARARPPAHTRARTRTPARLPTRARPRGQRAYTHTRAREAPYLGTLARSKIRYLGTLACSKNFQPELGSALPKTSRKPEPVSILPAQMIRARCIQTGLVTPFYERTKLRGRSFGLSAAGYDVRIAQSISLAAGQFTLASTVEHFAMPNDLIASVHDKSTWARVGLAVQNTIIEPGWEGYLTIEITNHGRDRLEIVEGDPIAQILFQTLVEPTEQPYQGKYQFQAPEPVPAILESVE